jgi:hypothetical protein
LKWNIRLWRGFIWLRIGTPGGLLRTEWWRVSLFKLRWFWVILSLSWRTLLCGIRMARSQCIQVKQYEVKRCWCLVMYFLGAGNCFGLEPPVVSQHRNTLALVTLECLKIQGDQKVSVHHITTHVFLASLLGLVWLLGSHGQGDTRLTLTPPVTLILTTFSW